MPVIPDIAVAENSVKTPETIEKPKKVLSQEDITTIANNVLSDFVDYLSENTEFYHMQDEIINKRMRVIMKKQYKSNIMETISEFINFLEEDENIQEYIAENGKISYNFEQTEAIHETISYYINGIFSYYIYDIPQGWLNIDMDSHRFYKSGEFHIYSIMKCLEKTIIKYVFQQYGDGYEFIDSKEKEQEEQEDQENQEDPEEQEEINNLGDYNEVKQKNECNIN